MTLNRVSINFSLSSKEDGNVLFHIDLVVIAVGKEMVDYFDFSV